MLIVFKSETFLITLRPQYILFCPSERYYTGYIFLVLRDHGMYMYVVYI